VQGNELLKNKAAAAEQEKQKVPEPIDLYEPPTISDEEGTENFPAVKKSEI
jgi:hypothetical protein